jgi:uncharacterized protein YcfJ
MSRSSVLHRVVLVAAVVLLAGCAQPLSTREKSTLTGGFIGGAAGSIIGAAVGNPAAGAAIGTAMGAGTGALIGTKLQSQDSQRASQHRQLEAQRHELEQLKRASPSSDDY